MVRVYPSASGRPQQPRSMAMIVACHGDAGPLNEAAQVAASLGYVVAGYGTDPRTVSLCVIVLSEAAVRDAAFLQYASTIAQSAPAVIPVRVDGVRPELAGDAIDRHNCADFSGLDQASRMQRWRELFRSNVTLYDAYNTLAADAERWERNGKGRDFLIQDVKRAGQSASLVAAMAQDPFSPSTPLMHDYTAASTTFAKSLQSKARWSRIRVITAVLVIIAMIAVGRYLTNRHNQQLITLQQVAQESMVATNPEYHTFRAIQAAEQIGDSGAALSYIRDGLARQWPVATFGVNATLAGNEWQGEGRFSEDGSKFYAEAAGGALQTWRVSDSSPIDSLQVSSSDRFIFDVDGKGTTAAVADAQGLRLVDLSSGRSQTLDSGITQAAHIAISTDAGTVLVDNGTQLAVWSGAALQSDTVDETLAIARVNGKLRALAVRDGRLRLIDGADLHVIWEVPLPDATFRVGAIAGNDMAVVSVDGIIYTASNGALAPAGYTTRTLPLAMAVSADGLLAVSTDQDGVTVFDLSARRELGTVCPVEVGTEYLDVSSNGLVSCNSGWYTQMWSLTELKQGAGQLPGADAQSLNEAIAAAKKRQPVCWPNANIQAFGSDFSKQYGLAACQSAPSPRKGE